MPESESKLTAGNQIHGVQLTKLDAQHDVRGSFTEVYKDRWRLCIKPVQWSVVQSEAGVLRGMHFHRRHDEFITIVSGRVSVGLRDLRQGSPTEGDWSLIHLTADDPASLSFPRSVVHGWYFHEPTVHLQAVSEDYETYGDNDNLTCRWDDPDLEIPWPEKDVVLSERADSSQSLKSLLASLACESDRERSYRRASLAAQIFRLQDGAREIGQAIETV